jgi:hypothetical protein
MPLSDEQKKLLIQYRDKSYVMSILCSECSDHYSRINNFFKFPLIITNSIMVIFNSENFENIKTANIILNVCTSLILSLVGNFKLNEKIINFSSKSIKFNKLCHKTEDLLYNSIDDITTENIKSIIDDYDSINEQIEYPFVGYIKKRLTKKYKSSRTLPNTLNCVCDSDIVVINNV